jgi:F-type H+-transporting ATPase subunit b
VRFRTRAMLASSLLAVGLVAFAPHASAQEEGGEEEEEHVFTDEEAEHIVHEAELLAEQNGAEHADVECIPLLAKGKSVDDCNEAPSPILPATDELVWGTLSFLVLLFLLWKFAFPAIKDGMNARTERIRADLAAAEGARTEAESVLEQHRQSVAGAKAEAGRIIEEARQAAEALKRDQEARLQAELAEMRARAAADIESAKAQAVADLQSDVAQLAVGAASVIVHRNLDAATQAQLVEDYINQVGTNQ